MHMHINNHFIPLEKKKVDKRNTHTHQRTISDAYGVHPGKVPETPQLGRQIVCDKSITFASHNADFKSREHTQGNSNRDNQKVTNRISITYWRVPDQFVGQGIGASRQPVQSEAVAPQEPSLRNTSASAVLSHDKWKLHTLLLGDVVKVHLSQTGTDRLNDRIVIRSIPRSAPEVKGSAHRPRVIATQGTA